jgi:hypothetical protein
VATGGRKDFFPRFEELSKNVFFLYLFAFCRDTLDAGLKKKPVVTRDESAPALPCALDCEAGP